MTVRWKRWLLVTGVAFGAALIVLLFIGRAMAERFEPYIRDQAIAYLEKRFDSEAEIGELRISVPNLSPYKLVFNHGKGTMAHVEAERVVLRHKKRRDIAPMFVMKRFTFDVDLGTVFDSTKRVQLVTIDGMEVNVPPQGERPDLGGSDEDAEAEKTNVILDEVRINDSRLR